MSFGVTVSDKWMKAMIDGDKEKRRIWGKIIKKRFESGYPYIMFSDTVNKKSPKVYRDKRLVSIIQTFVQRFVYQQALVNHLFVIYHL